MKSPLMIKGNKYGFQIVLDPDLPFEELVRVTADKFRESGGFFDQDKPVAVKFEKRSLTDAEQDILVDTIMDNSSLRIGYIIDGARKLESEFAAGIRRAEKKAARSPATAEISPESFPEEPGDLNYGTEGARLKGSLRELFHSEQPTEKNGQFYRGTLRSGQSIEVDGSIVILGDINPGAQVTAGGNVVVLGSVKGIITAGYPSDKSALVAALSMDPMQIKIGEVIARAPDQKGTKGKKKTRRKQSEAMEPKLAFVEDNNIFIEPITRELINEFGSAQPE